MSLTDPAQKTIVERFLSWPLVRQRLDRYPAIARAFPLDVLERYKPSPPYFCHYMAWRLGVWHCERHFARLEELLVGAEGMPNWAAERPMLENAEFAEYWSLMWQLQIAEYLRTLGTAVEWCGTGPDLRATINGDTVYVECFVYRKSFGARAYLEELLSVLGDDIRIDHDYFAPLSLPTDQARTAFFDAALSPFLDSGRLKALRAQAQHAYPVEVVAPASTLRILIDGPDIGAYDPTLDKAFTGDPTEYLRIFIGEVIRTKQGRNSLGAHRPNLVAANYLLSTEAQVARELRQIQITEPLGANLDAVAVGAVGIDARVTKEDLVLVAGRDPLPSVIHTLAEVQIEKTTPEDP